MNTIIFQTIRVSIFFGIALFMFVSDVFAAPVLTPVSVSQITVDSATLTGHISNPNVVSSVWFEYGEDATLSNPNTVGMNSVYNEGFFQVSLTGLTAGNTYYYRSASMEANNTVYSRITSFKATSLNTQIIQTSIVSNTKSNTKITSNTAPKVANTSSVNNMKSGTVASGSITNVNTNRNTASVIGAGNNIFPSTLIGWVALIISVLVVVLFASIIFEQSAKRKKDEIIKIHGAEQAVA